jgi:ABC-type methionine transport system ATPase subunit
MERLSIKSSRKWGNNALGLDTQPFHNSQQADQIMTINHQWQPVSHPEADLNLDRSGLDRPAQRRIKIRVPKHHIEEPVVSRLASNYNLEVNIISALLGAMNGNDGWFDLQLQGKSRSIEEALFYLSELDIEIWYDSSQILDESDDW